MINNKLIDNIKQINRSNIIEKYYYIHSYGCQQNVTDSERISGLLEMMGYKSTKDANTSDIIIYNTCCVRHTANDRILGNIGALKNLKSRKPGLIIGICGCMVEQKKMAEFISDRFKYVNLIFGTNLIHQLPEFIYKILSTGKRVMQTKINNDIIENLMIKREDKIKCLVPIMYGCDNFCSYCVVPYVRGGERSREIANILKEVEQAIFQGCKEIVLLGQNVNSYGKNLVPVVNFAKLLSLLCNLDGDFRIRFLTSHPKDCSKELIDIIAGCDKICKHIHIPFQSGSNRVLQLMNRKYTKEQYLDLVKYIKKQIPNVSLSSDVIVGFPGETYEEFFDTLELIKKVEFDFLFTFIFSKRSETKAALMEDTVLPVEKKKWFNELLEVQNTISDKKNASQIGKIKNVLPETCRIIDDKSILLGRCENNFLIEFVGPEGLIGEFTKVQITNSTRRSLVGKLV